MTSPNQLCRRGVVAIAAEIAVWVITPLDGSAKIRCVIAVRMIRWMSDSGMPALAAIEENDVELSIGKVDARLKR